MTKEVPVYPPIILAMAIIWILKIWGIEYALLPADSYSGLGLQGNIIQKIFKMKIKSSHIQKK
ncbi:hypothetical protein AB6H17_10880 [Proteus vulgaris]|uniref:hypothetical protein n=1 Tax=Proteus vulgaris TaxID=585 RepID=UPI0034DD105F